MSRRFAPRIGLIPKGRPLSPEEKTARRRAQRENHDRLVEAILEHCAWKKWPATVTDAERVHNARGQVRQGKVLSGWPDITGTMPPTGRAWCIEVKTGRARLERDQPEVHARLLASGAAVYVAHTIHEAVEFLDLLHAGELRKANLLRHFTEGNCP